MSLEAAANGDQRALQVLAEIFADMIDAQDRTGTLPCPITIPVISAILFAPLSPESIPLSRKQYPHAIRAIVRFLMAPRTLQERRALHAITLHTELECHCVRDGYGGNQRVRDIHAELAGNPGYRRTLPGTDVPPLQHLLGVFCFTLSQFITCTFENTSIKSLVRQAKRCLIYDRRQAWPRNSQDLFPFGVAQSITALCEWLEPHPQTEVLRLLHISWENVLQLPFPGLLVNIIVPRAVSRILTARLAELEKLKGAPQLTRPRIREAIVDIVAISVGPLQMLDGMEDRPIRAAVVNDLHTLSDLSDLCLRTHNMLSACARLSGSPPIDGAEHACIFYVKFATRMYNLFAGTPIADISSESRKDAGLQHNPVYQLTAYGRFLTAPLVCARPGCHHTHFSLGHPLLRCAGCWRAFYCSKKCQKVAWRHASSPHGDVCMDLITFADDMCNTLWGFEPPTVVLAARHKVCRDMQVDKDVMERIIRHLEACYAGREFADTTTLDLGSEGVKTASN